MKILEKWWFWFGFAVLLYINTMNHSYVIDDMIVVNNNSLTKEGISSIPEIFKHSYLFGYDGREDESYRPLTLSTFAIERSLFDANSSMSHFVQILLYGLCIVLLFKLLSEIFPTEKSYLIYIVTGLFLIHPIHTEVVVNVKSRDELLCALFLFWSLLFFVKYVKSKKISQIVLSAVLFFLATLSKETAVPSIILFPALNWVMNKDNLKQVVLNSIVFFVPLLIYIGIRTSVLSDVLIQDPIDPVANSLALADSTSEFMASNFAIFSKYLQLLVLPFNLSWDYSISTFETVGFNSITALLGLLFLLVIVGLMLIGLWKRSMVGFGALLFLATFAVTSNFFFLINCVLGERFMFIPLLGFLLMLIPLLDKLNASISNKKIILIPVLLIAVFYVGRTATRNMDWKDNISIYEAVTAISPNSVKAHFNLGTEYLQQGNLSTDLLVRTQWYEKAKQSLNTARSIYPKYANIYENLGYILIEQGKLTSNPSQKRTFFEEGLTVLNLAIDSFDLKKNSLFINKYYVLEQFSFLENDSLKKNEYYLEMLKTVQAKEEQDADDFHRQIYLLTQLKMEDELLKYAQENSINFPEKADLISELAKRYFSTSEFETSLKYMVLYTHMRPDDLSSESNKGMLLEILGRKNEALLIYEGILKRDPNQLHTKQLYEKLKAQP
jgi:protein O-mannosyl-transferase